MPEDNECSYSGLAMYECAHCGGLTLPKSLESKLDLEGPGPEIPELRDCAICHEPVTDERMNRSGVCDDCNPTVWNDGHGRPQSTRMTKRRGED